MSGNWTIDDSGNIRETSASDPNRILFGLQILTQAFVIASADMLTLDSVPVQLVPAPGANKVLVCVGIALRQRYGSATYTCAGTVNVGIGPIANSNIVSSDIKTTVTAAADAVGVGVGAGIRDDLANMANEPLNLYASSAVAVGDGTFSGTVSYMVLDVPVPAVP